MKTRLLIGTVVLFLGITLYSCKPNDQKLQQEVNTVLTTSGVTAVVKDAVVTLTGTVESKESKDEAEALCKKVKDIKSVVNNIEVKEPVPAIVISPDEALKTIVTSGLAAAGYPDIVAQIDSGQVTLTGNVKKADVTKVMQIVNEAKPKKVINKLTIK